MTAEKPVRKFPPPCWTQDEALALIEAYRERWYALRRGYLRTADWDAVAEQVGYTCPGAMPPKTSAQCRHKMEKLRQRYRAEKQRSLSFPGRFFSSWFYFEAMEHGSNGEGDDPANSSLKIVNFQKKDDGTPNPNFDQIGLNPGRGIRFKPIGDRNLVTLASRGKNSGKTNSNMKSTRVSNLDYSSQYVDVGSDKEDEDGAGAVEFGDGYLVETPIDENLVPLGYRGKVHKNSSQGFAPRFQSEHHGMEDSGNFRVKAPIYQESDRAGLRPRKFSKVEKVNPNFWDDGSNGNNQVDADGELWVKVPRDRSMAPAAFRGKYGGKMERNPNPGSSFDSSGMNGCSSIGKKSGDGGGGVGTNKEIGAVADMISSIKLLGDGFMKMEKMKMEMTREIEKMRMESEMKRNELILESQKQIVEAFVKGLAERRRKEKPTGATES